MMRKLIVAMGAAGAALGLAAAPLSAKEKPAAATPAAAAIDLAAAKSGVYAPDAYHRHLYFTYLHQGYSTSYVRWRDWTGELKWNAENPGASSVKVTISADKVDSGFDVFDGHLKGEKFFDTAKHPTITFASKSLTKKGLTKGELAGDLTIKGVTKPVKLEVTLNKAGFDERAKAHKLGFSAKGTVKRSDWGLDAAIPFVGDEVTIIVEAEFQSPAAAPK